jgi:hypothetical protein
MKLAVMQPYFLPYIGYFQLIASVDRFVVYDNIKYTKRGWINRNRLLVDARDVTFSIPLKNASDSLDVRDREIAVEFRRDKLINQFSAAYRRAPHFAAVMPLVEETVRFEDPNLFSFLHHSIVTMCRHLDIQTDIVVSSHVDMDHGLRGQERVLALCAALGATTYVNSIGGLELYSKAEFARENVELRFLRSLPVEYQQFGAPFVPWLSIIDVLMFNSIETVRQSVFRDYEMV